MSFTRAFLAIAGLLLAECAKSPADSRSTSATLAEAPAIDPWPTHAAAIVDSVRFALMHYGERFNAADRDSVQRFYVDAPGWKWATDGRLGKASSLMIQSRLDRLASYPRWHLGYRDLSITPLAPGLAVVFADYRMGFDGTGRKPLVYDGALTTFWHHQPQGWKMVGGHSSTRLASEP